MAAESRRRRDTVPSGQLATRSRSSAASRSSRRSSRPAAARDQRARARRSGSPQHRPPLRLDARSARLPPAGRRDPQVPPRAAGARPRLLGDQLDGAARDRRAAPAAAERRDGPHRQHGDPRRHRHRLRRALPQPQPGQREIDLNLHVGSRLPAYCTSMGKVLLAFLPRRARRRGSTQLALAPRGPNTLDDAAGAVRASSRACATAGLAVNDEELA